MSENHISEIKKYTGHSLMTRINNRPWH